MKNSKRSLLTVSAMAIALSCLGPGAALAGNPVGLNASGRPFVWPNGGRNIIFKTDLGNLGTMTNSVAVAQTVTAFNQWQNIPTASATYINGGSLGVDVNETNFVQFFDNAPQGVGSVIYDADGAIFDLIFGPGSTVFGFTGFSSDPTSGQITSSYIFLNGAAVDASYPFGVSAAEFLGVQVHEIGHLSGLGHSVVNGEFSTTGDTTGPTPYDTFSRPSSFAGQTETMYPFILPGGGQETPHADDRAIFSTLYPEPGFFASTGTIKGRIRLNGRVPVNGVNVIARNVADPFGDAVSAISGNLAATNALDDPRAGAYILNGLTPGAQYAVYVDQIVAGSFSTEVRSGLPGPEELYNGAHESDNSAAEDSPNEFTPLTALAGSPLKDIDIVFNHRRPGPIPLETLFGFDTDRPSGALELILPFPFAVGGQRFDTVFLNAFNGSFTFGHPGPTLIRSGRSLDLVTGPPRIAGLFTSLDLFSGGVVSLSQTRDDFTIQTIDAPTSLPDLSDGGPNSFAMTLQSGRGRERDRAILSYGRIDAPSGLAGYSCGIGLTSWVEPESDLSTLSGGLIRGEGHTAIFEEFTQGIDLDHRTLRFEMPDAFADRFEPNNSRASARRVDLPFDTAQDFADISPGDVDFYRFRARAGEILVAETTFNQLDTMIGLFGAQGNLLASNDDIVPGVRQSRVIFTVPADGEYTVAVTTHGDTGFTGAGSESGRYVLTINTYKGRVLPLNGDDVTAQVPLRFRFPFQGREWRSVFVSSNGNLTFGAPETVNVREDLQLPGFLAGPPRIAPYFADLDPAGTYTGLSGGLVIADEQTDSLTVHWVSVPRIYDYQTNTFSVRLNSDGDIKMGWGPAINADSLNDGTVVGVSPGNDTADPGPTDLSRRHNLSARGTTYEQFAQYFLASREAFDIPSFDLFFDDVTFSREGPRR